MSVAGRPLLAFLLGLVLLLAGCDGFLADSPKASWERTMQAYANRDYGDLWDQLADVSHQDTERVLTHVRHDPRYRQNMQMKLQITATVLDAMTPREFFVALMDAVERVAPEAIALRAETARDARFSRESINGDQAVVFWDSAKGGPETMAFIREFLRWRPVIRRPTVGS
ncbi:MAG: hypothetical protein ACU85U_18950 [Gammaproteobacteria bacterium]